MRSQSIARPLATMIAVLLIACGGAPSAGGGNSSAPSASASASTPAATASIAPSAAPSAPAQSAYLDDRSSPEQLIRSYYNALSLRQYLRGYGYWERSSTLPTYDAFADGFADTTAVEDELGMVGGGTGAGQLYWSVPVAVLSIYWAARIDIWRNRTWRRLLVKGRTSAAQRPTSTATLHSADVKTPGESSA
jgi:hypothetical protein